MKIGRFSISPRHNNNNDFELPHYTRGPGSPDAPYLTPCGSTKSLSPPPPIEYPPLEADDLQKLYPVHHILLHHLADLEPLKALTLSRYTYDILSPYIYRRVAASKSLLCGLELEVGYERKLKALQCVETLYLESKDAVWHVAMLGLPSNVPRQYEGVFSGVKVVVTTLAVTVGTYHEHVGGSDNELEYADMLKRITPQLTDGWEEKEDEDGGFWDARSGHFVMEGGDGAPPAAAASHTSTDTAIGVVIALIVIIGPIVLFLVAALATRPIHSLSLATVTANNALVGFGPEGNITVPIKISVGVGSGCIWYNNTGPMCSYGLPWRPDPALLHLPETQLLTSCFPTDAGRALFLNHVLAALSILSVIYAFYDLPSAGPGFGKKGHIAVGFVFVLSWVMFGITLGYSTSLKNNIRRLEDVEGYRTQTGQAVWLLLVGALLQTAWAMATDPAK
ncbi:hypothetical protein IAT38_000943 [Cryptococcus sp. DSM 104549]